MSAPAFFDGCAMIGRCPGDRPEHSSRPHELLAQYEYLGISAGLVHHADALGPEPHWANHLLLEEIADSDAMVPQWVLLPHGDGRMPPARELVSEMLQRGVRAARIFPRTHCFPLTDDICAPLLRALQEHRVPLFAEMGEVSIEAASALCARYPELPVVLCGVPWGHDRGLLPALEACPDLHVETHAFYGHRAFERIAARFGAHRLIFGTGLPGWDAGAAIMMPLYEALSEEDRAAMAGGNLLRLLEAVDADGPLPRLKESGPREDDDAILACIRAGRPLTDEFIFDVHGHIGHEGSMGTAEWCVPLTDADSLVGTMDRLGVNRSIVSSWAGLMMGDPAASEITLRAVKRHPGRLLGYACINPGYPEIAQREVRRLFRDGAMAGYKPYPARHHVPILDARHRPMLEWCDRRGLPVLCHGWLGGDAYVTPSDLDVLAPMYPGAQFVSTHVGGSWEFAEALMPVIRRHSNVYADPTYPVTPAGIVEYIVREAGAHRVLFGSDALLIDPASQIGWIAWARMPVEDKRAILGLNLARLLGGAPLGGFSSRR